MIRKTTLLALFSLAYLAAAQDEIEFEEADEVIEDEDEMDDLTEQEKQAIAYAMGITKRNKKQIAKAAVIQPVDDFAPGTWIGISSIIGFIWWLVFGWFLFIETNLSDVTMNTISGSSTVKQMPFLWFWNNFDNPEMGWTAATYFSYFIAYFVVSTIEFIAWIMYLTGDSRFFASWAESAGTWGSMILYIFPILFSILQCVHYKGDIYRNGYTNAVVQALAGVFGWIVTYTIHMVFIDRLSAHVNAVKKSGRTDACVCMNYKVHSDANEDERIAGYAIVTKKCEAKLLQSFCQEDIRNNIVKNCAVERDEDENDLDYQDRCENAEIEACPLDREDEEGDMNYIIRCMVNTKYGDQASAVAGDGEFNDDGADAGDEEEEDFEEEIEFSEPDDDEEVW